MTPLEMMARAAFERQDGFRWEDYPGTQAQVIKDMRAALLALAEAELPTIVIGAGAEAIVGAEEEHTRRYLLEATVAFRAMCRAIAEDRS